MLEVKSPNSYANATQKIKVFLAGSIEMGAAVDWRTEVCNSLKDIDVLLLNPLRETWDAAWLQDISNPQFREQVEWELSGIQSSDLVLMYFDPTTQSPISLLELGMCADKAIMVCCGAGYWRRGNVQVVCNKYGIPLYDDKVAFIHYARERILGMTGIHVEYPNITAITTNLLETDKQ